jgi:hypothetical protein
MQIIRNCADRARAEWTRPYCLRSRQLVTSVSRKAQPFLLTAAVLGTTVIAAGNSATDRFRAPLTAPFQPSPKPAEATSMPWTVEVPTHPQPAPELAWPDPEVRDLPDLVAAPPHDERSAATGSHGASHRDSTSNGGDPAIWLLLGAVPLSAAAVVLLRRRRSRPGPDEDSTDVGLTLLEPDQREGPETGTEVPPDARPLDSCGALAAIAAVPSAAATDSDPVAATSAAPRHTVALPAPGGVTQAEAPPRSNAGAPRDPPAGSSNGGAQRENARSRVVLFERRPGTRRGR